MDHTSAARSAFTWALVAAAISDVALLVDVFVNTGGGWTFYTPYSKPPLQVVLPVALAFGTWSAAIALGGLYLRLSRGEAKRSARGLVLLVSLVVPFGIYAGSVLM